MIVAVVGATGYIGQALCATLQSRGHVVRSLARPRGAGDPRPDGDFHPVDVAVLPSLAGAFAGADAVVNLAGLSRANRDTLYDRVNVRGAANVAQAVAEHAIGRLVHVSHLGAQGPSVDGHVPAEAGREVPMDAHGRSRLRGEKAVADYAEEAACILRPAWVTGAEDPQLHRLISMVRRGVAPSVTGATVSFVSRTALCELIADICEREEAPTGPHFVADGQVEVSTLLDIIERNAGGRPAVRVPVAAGLLARFVPVAERVAAVAGVGQGWGQWLRALSAGSWVCDAQGATKALGFQPNPEIIRLLSEAVRAQA